MMKTKKKRLEVLGVFNIKDVDRKDWLLELPIVSFLQPKISWSTIEKVREIRKNIYCISIVTFNPILV